jgi:hypothetical protein
MKTGMRFLSRLIRSASLLLICITISPQPTSLQPASPAGESAGARINLEVRLRKLHLVRPDLIPYPVCYEVYC